MRKSFKNNMVLSVFFLLSFLCCSFLSATVPQGTSPIVIKDNSHVPSFLDSLKASGNKKNVVFVLVDDMGWRDLQCYGSDLYETPYIDAFAKTAMRFTDAYSASPLCSPTRASILTGLEPGRLRLTTPACHLPKVVLDPKENKTANPVFKATIPGTCTRLRNEYITIGEVFKTLGYSTAFMGKWHLGREPYVPENQGFDLVIGGREHPGPPGGYFSPWSCNTLPVVPSGTHICDVLTDKAMDYITDHKEDPFMLCLWYYDVHAPFQAKSELVKKYAAKVTDDNVQRSPLMAAMVGNLDTNVGRLLNKISSLGLDENTIVVFTSDNGGNMYNCPQGQLATNNAPLREGKGNNYEGGVRVPLIIRVPGLTTANSVSNVVTSTVDHYVSLMELVGVEVPQSLKTDGYSYVPALKGKNYDRAPIYTAFCHRTPKAGNLPNVSMRDKEWKLYRFYYDGPDQQHRYELYNLQKDIGETNNVADKESKRLKKMIAMMDAHVEEAGYLVSQANKNYAGNSVGVWWGSDAAKLSVVDNALHIQVGEGEAYVETDMIPGFDGASFVVSFDMKSSTSGLANLAWKTDKRGPYSPEKSQSIETINDGQWHSYHVSVKDTKVNVLRLNPSPIVGDILIKNIQMETTDGFKIRAWDLNYSSQ